MEKELFEFLVRSSDTAAINSSFPCSTTADSFRLWGTLATSGYWGIYELFLSHSQ